MIKKHIASVMMFAALVGMAWGGEPAKTNEQEITLPAIKISKMRTEQPSQKYALSKKGSSNADQNRKKDTPADKEEGTHSM